MSSRGRRTSESEGKPKLKQRRGIRGLFSRIAGKEGSAAAPTPAVTSSAAKPSPSQAMPLTALVAPISPRPMTGRSSVGSSSFHSTESAENRRGADEDASIRPISPHSTARSIPASLQTSSGASDVRTFRSAATGQSHSTKPTTLLSVGSDGGEGNRIAVASTPASRYAQDRRLSGLASAASAERRESTPAASIVFSTLPQSGGGSASGVYPRHTQPDTRRNPAPHSAALDNASTLTLASSTAPTRAHVPMDENASVRALPPTPTRRPSDGSIGSSRWSAAVAAAHRLGGDGASYRTGAYAASSMRRTSLTGTVPSEYRMRRDSSSEGETEDDPADRTEDVVEPGAVVAAGEPASALPSATTVIAAQSSRPASVIAA